MRDSGIERASKRILTVRSLQRASHTEYYLVGFVEGSATAAEAAGDYFAQAAALLADRRIETIQEKVYGRAGARDAILEIRRRELGRRGLDPDTPLTYLEGQPLGDCDFAGVQIWGVAPREHGESGVTTIRVDDAAAGRCWQGQGFRMLHLSEVCGTQPEGKLPSCVTHQAEQMFDNAGKALDAHGLGYLHVVRTWIYLARLLDWYGEFNRVRTVRYAAEGMTGKPREAVFPASTGIQGRSADEECVMDVLAVEATVEGAVRVEPILGSWRQPPAFSYGSSFSRGMALVIEGRKTIYISGTASINPHGETTHVGDAEGQCLETLQDIAAILEEQGGGLDDIASATVFCKSREVYEAFRNVTRLLQVPAFPYVAVLADVCRSDLLIEIEATAFITLGRGPGSPEGTP